MSNIKNELEEISRKLKLVLDGNLNISFHKDDNILTKDITRSLDELLANSQEILLYTAAIVIDIKKQMEIMPAEDKENLKEISKRLAQLEDMIKDFDFYHVKTTSNSIIGTETGEFI